MTVRERRGYYHDDWLRDRHRLWGFDCPATDIDFIAIEFNNEAPTALVDYKEDHHTQNLNDSRSGRNAIKALANNSKIPFYVVRYVEHGNTYRVLSQNEYGYKRLLEHGNIAGKTLTEVEYVSFLYWLRGMTVPDSVVEAIVDTPQ